ncbi:FAD dependent oxidoreductase [Gloeothece citriformis PCC 7424]|uniref:FAD dependent oxidoreductase n=1 Tax=Gloeothece citriformis (strain PCC 7424) TaxID=65393 RepID=B7KGD2_GLOC7|nr:FAD-binding oxidoreductase [Gloeothece citriformis]ACK70603.1 FAD dependent oxidoreductase [Gloeothece citriformis PCC 7424]
MTNSDIIVIGGGITGSALSYELAKKGLKVLLLEKDAIADNATQYSYGGLAYWSGTTELTRQLCQEGINIHRNLSAELDADTEFREISLILTIDAGDDPNLVFQNYGRFAIPPQLLTVEQGCEVEPLLNPKAISGVLKLPHGHINTQKTSKAYQQGFCRLGGEIKIEQVTKLLREKNRIIGVETPQGSYFADKVIVAAGGLSRFLLAEAGINVRLYFTHAQLIKTPPIKDIKLRTLIMPAVQKRLIMESNCTQTEREDLWTNPSSELMEGIIEPGAIQFLDHSFVLGQISQVRTDYRAAIDPVTSEAEIRTEIGRLLPLLHNIPGTWHSCLVAFANNSRPLVGEINNFSGIYLFSGFTSPLVFAPPLARHFASWIGGENDKIIRQLSPVS